MNIWTILAGILIILVLVIGVAYFRFGSQIDSEINELISGAKPSRDAVITEQDLDSLPAPVQRLLQYSNVVGKRIPKIIRLKQVGRIRQDAKSKWMEIEAEEIYSTNPPGFVWRVWMPKRSQPMATGRDLYADGKGSMIIKMLAMFPVANQSNTPEMNQGAMMRYLNEMMWFPQAYLGSNISWRAIDDSTAEITLIDKGQRSTARISIDGEGKLTNFVARRYRSAATGNELREWATPVSGYHAFDGVKIPTTGQAMWTLDDGPFAYIELAIDSVEYEY